MKRSNMAINSTLTKIALIMGIATSESIFYYRKYIREDLCSCHYGFTFCIYFYYRFNINYGSFIFLFICLVYINLLGPIPSAKHLFYLLLVLRFEDIITV
jgi:hypothetical protein